MLAQRAGRARMHAAGFHRLTQSMMPGCKSDDRRWRTTRIAMPGLLQRNERVSPPPGPGRAGDATGAAGLAGAHWRVHELPAALHAAEAAVRRERRHAPRPNSISPAAWRPIRRPGRGCRRAHHPRATPRKAWASAACRPNARPGSAASSAPAAGAGIALGHLHAAASRLGTAHRPPAARALT